MMFLLEKHFKITNSLINLLVLIKCQWHNDYSSMPADLDSFVVLFLELV